MDMASTNPRLQGSEALRAELTRLFSVLVEVRWSRVPLPVLGFVVLALFDPTLVRCLVAAVAATVVVAVSWIEHRRFRLSGLDPRFIARNAAEMAIWHLSVFLLTGALLSPLLPIFVVFTLAANLMIGADPAGRLFRGTQLTVLLILTAVQLAGWDQALTPAWLHAPSSTAHTLLRAGFLVLFLRGARTIGLTIRGLFDAALTRTAEAREDLLDAHRDQNEALTALSGAIAHELKNPLASIKGLGGLLARDLPEGKPAERLGVLRAEVDRMQGILDGFLNFSRPAVPVVATVVDVRALCDDVAGLHEGMARAAGVRLGVAGGGTARLDARKTREVLINLVQNALDASAPGAAVVVAVELRGDRLLLTVDDEGLGLDPGLGARVFEAGVTTKPSGSGLGLTVARALARQQGGELTLTNRSPRGCRATLTLPAGGVA